jgi:hypothetical protein
MMKTGRTLSVRPGIHYGARFSAQLSQAQHLHWAQAQGAQVQQPQRVVEDTGRVVVSDMADLVGMDAADRRRTQARPCPWGKVKRPAP